MQKFSGIENLISIDHEDYRKCIDVIEHNEVIDEVIATLRIHHLKFDGNGRPMTKALAELLYSYIIHYCISSRNRPSELSLKDATKLTKEARSLFIHPETSEDDPDQTGEAGEALLFFLIESVIQAPQIVAKMELKTNRKKESNGSDGIHMRWNEEDNVVDFFFGESKLYKDIDKAISAVIKSISEFHDQKTYKHEFTMITKHFKYADERIKEQVTKLIALGEPSDEARINHACLIGYNWAEFDSLPKLRQKELTEEFKKKLAADSGRLAKLVNKKFKDFDKKHLLFDIFFIPFPSVQAFRDDFNAALN